MKPPAGVTDKKAYAPPQFSKYGTLTEMTQAAGSGSMGDASKGKGNKT